MKALLDTDMLSEVLKSKDPGVVARSTAYRNEQARYTFSTITVIEIVKGLSRRGREDAIERFFAIVDESELLTLDRVSAELAGRLYGDLERSGRPIGVSDYVRVQEAGYPLVLENWRDRR